MADRFVERVWICHRQSLKKDIDKQVRNRDLDIRSSDPRVMGERTGSRMQSWRVRAERENWKGQKLQEQGSGEIGFSVKEYLCDL